MGEWHGGEKETQLPCNDRCRAAPSEIWAAGIDPSVIGFAGFIASKQSVARTRGPRCGANPLEGRSSPTSGYSHHPTLRGKCLPIIEA